MKAPVLPDVQNYMPQDTLLIELAENAHQGLSISEVIFTYGKLSRHFMNVP
jgi:hypothetical protein